MDEFVFSGNRQRWPYLRPIVVAAVVGGSAWLATCCLALLQAPALPVLCLGTHVLPASHVLSLRALPASAPGRGRGIGTPTPGPAGTTRGRTVRTSIPRSLAEGVGLRPAVVEQ
jgi:hypothetical protein